MSWKWLAYADTIHQNAIQAVQDALEEHSKGNQQLKTDMSDVAVMVKEDRQDLANDVMGNNFAFNPVKDYHIPSESEEIPPPPAGNLEPPPTPEEGDNDGS